MGSFFLEEVAQVAAGGVGKNMNKIFERIDSACNTGSVNSSCISMTMKSVLKALCTETEPLKTHAIMRIMRTNHYEYSTVDMSLVMDRLVNMGMVSEIVTRELHHQSVAPRVVIEKLYIIEPLTAMHVHAIKKGL